jgi:hypothetical protein
MSEAGVSIRLGVGGVGEEKLVSRVKDEPIPLGVSLLDDWFPIRNIDFHELVGVEEPVRVARRLSVDLEWEKMPRDCKDGVDMRDVWKDEGKVTGREGMRRSWADGKEGRGWSGDVSKERETLQAFLMSIFGKVNNMPPPKNHSLCNSPSLRATEGLETIRTVSPAFRMRYCSDFFRVPILPGVFIKL